MGVFINEVAKNNRLQEQILTEKQQKERKREKEKREKDNERTYRASLVTLKKEISNNIYYTLEQQYKLYNIFSYNKNLILKNKNEILENILQNLLIGINIQDVYELKRYAKSEYNKINKFLYNEYKQDNKAIFEIEKEKQKEKFETIPKSKKTVSIFNTFITIFFGAISGIVWSCKTYKKKKR